MSYIFLMQPIFWLQVYNDADILEKILKDKRKELGPLPEEEDVGSPKLKLSTFDHISVFACLSPFSKNGTLYIITYIFLKCNFQGSHRISFVSLWYKK